MRLPWPPLARLTSRLSRPQREVAWFAFALLVGVALLPLLVWGVGRIALGAYANGGALALWGDFLRGLAQGSLPYWTLALGPYAALLGLRLVSRLVRSA